MNRTELSFDEVGQIASRHVPRYDYDDAIEETKKSVCTFPLWVDVNA